MAMASSSHLFVLLSIICIFFSISLVLAAHQSITTPFILETCEKTSYKDECVQLFSTSQKAATADLKGLVAVALEVTEKKASRMAGHISNLLDDPHPPTLQQCIGDCEENYEDVLDQLNDAIGELDKITTGQPSDPEDDATLWLAAAMSDIETCEKGCNMQTAEKNVLTARNAEITKLCNITMSVLDQLVIH